MGHFIYNWLPSQYIEILITIQIILQRNRMDKIMVRLLLAFTWLLYLVNMHANAMDQVIAKAMLEKARHSGLIVPYMQAYNLITADEVENRASNYNAIAEIDVDICDLPHLRAYCWQPTYLSKTGIANAMTEFRVLEGIVVYGQAPKLRMFPPNVRDYINRLEADRAAAQNELKRARRVALMPADQLDHSPQFSPARPRNDITVYLHNQSNGGLVNTPGRSRALFSGSEDGAATFTMMARFTNSPENTVQQTPVDRRILNIRRAQEARLREQNALMSEAQRRAMEAERVRDTLLENFQTLGDAHAESQIVLALQEGCLDRYNQIRELTRIITQDTAAMHGNFLYLRGLRNSLENCESDLEKTLKTLKDIVHNIRCDLPSH